MKVRLLATEHTQYLRVANTQAAGVFATLNPNVQKPNVAEVERFADNSIVA